MKSSWKMTAVAALFGFTLAASALAVPAQAEPTGSTPGQISVTSGIEVKDMDSSIAPGTDFFQYATGGWQKANPIPSDQSRWGTFNILDDNNTALVHKILEEAAKNPQGNLEKQLGQFYASGMDEKAINARGMEPLKDELKAIDNIHSLNDLQRVVAHLNTINISPYFCLFDGQDDKDSSRVIATINQDGLGLPERDYYFRTDANSVKIRAQYVDHIARMFRHMGIAPSEAERQAKAVMALETKLAQASLPAAEMRDPQKTYNLMSQKELNALTPHIDWSAYCKGLGLKPQNEYNVIVPGFLKAVDRELVKGTSLEDHKSYLRWQLINTFAAFLSSDWEQMNFDFYSKTLSGVSEMRPRWKRITSVMNAYMDQGIGQLYVKKAFSPAAKAKVEEIVNNITKVMERDIPNLEWMSPATQKEALVKLHSFRAKIGYPEKPIDYSTLKVTDNYFDNIISGRQFDFKRRMNKIGKPVDRDEWHMPPQMVNAYYSPCDNQIVFPAGILQPPFFDEKADDAVNYGAIGMVIGHEISHGFDDQGSQYDGKGNLRSWWTDEDRAKFEKLAKGVEDQYSSYIVLGQHLNGKLVLGESIADLSGLALSYRAYKLAHPEEEPVINGFSADQRFFLAFAKVWATNIKPERLKLQINTDPHPPAMWRVNGTVSNMPEFYKAFEVKEGDPMCRPQDQRNKIW